MAVTDGPAAAVRYVGISLGTLSSIASSRCVANDLGPFFVATAPRVDAQLTAQVDGLYEPPVVESSGGMLNTKLHVRVSACDLKHTHKTLTLTLTLRTLRA